MGDLAKATQESTMRDVVAKLLYPPIMGGILLVMISSVIFSVVVVYQMDWVGGAIEPDWFHTFIAKPLGFVAKIIKPSAGNARALSAITVLLTGMILGVFLNKCSSQENVLETFLTISFLILAVIQLVMISILPNALEAEGQLKNGKEIVENLTLLLKANANVAMAIFGAALGVKMNFSKP